MSDVTRADLAVDTGSMDGVISIDDIVPNYNPNQRRLIKAAIALSVDIGEADKYVTEFSKITDDLIPSLTIRSRLKDKILCRWFGLSLSATYSPELDAFSQSDASATSDNEVKSVEDIEKAEEIKAVNLYNNTLRVILSLKWG